MVRGRSRKRVIQAGLKYSQSMVGFTPLAKRLYNVHCRQWKFQEDI
jgi:hypothetical protein